MRLSIKLKLTVGLIIATISFIAKGETKLIISEFELNIQTNESAIIVSDHFIIPYAVKDGITNVISVAQSASAHKPYIVTGPIKLYFTQGLLTYRMITNTPFKTMFLRCGETNNIVISSNQTIRMFENSSGGESVVLNIVQGGNSLPFFPATEYGTEYDGPLNFNFNWSANISCRCLNQFTNCNDSGDSCLITNYCSYVSLYGGYEYCLPVTNACNVFTYNKGFLFNYYIIDEFLSTPFNGYVENSPGSLILTVEKSTTLTNWFPAFITSTGDDQHTFYRLKMSRKDAGLTGGGGSFLFNGGGSMSYYENWESALPPLPPGLEYIE